MTADALEAWKSLYAACAVLAMIAALAAAARIAFDVAAGGPLASTTDWRGRLMFWTRLWLRWQLAYLSATPMILLIIVMFAGHLGFGVFVAV